MMTAPTPVKIGSRICFAIAYFLTEVEAKEYSALVKAQGYTYNGGMFHGMPCGRDSGFDYVDEELGQLYAVTN
jgi:hypothetical protein